MRLRRPAAAAHIDISDKSHGLPYSKGLMASSVMMAPTHLIRGPGIDQLSLRISMGVLDVGLRSGQRRCP